MNASNIKKPGSTSTVLSQPLHQGQVIELYGDEGTGKSQCLLHLLAQLIMPAEWEEKQFDGLDKSVLYIDNNHTFCMLRLTAILEQRLLKAYKNQNIAPGESDIDELIKICLSKLYIVRCVSSSQFIITLHSLLKSFKNNSNLCVVMIDSISSFYWMDRSNSAESISSQESNMIKIADVIGILKNQYDATIYATKHAIFVRKDEEDASTKSYEHCEYLSKAWQKQVSQRWIFSKQFVQEQWRYTMKLDKGKNNVSFLTFNIDETGLVLDK